MPTSITEAARLPLRIISLGAGTALCFGLLFVVASSDAHAEQRRINYGVVSLCPSPEPDNKCAIVTAGQSFTVVPKRSTPQMLSIEWAGKSWWADRKEIERSTTLEKPKHSADVRQVIAKMELDRIECERRGNPRVGMNRQQLYESCWGAPSSINVTETAAGKSEQMVYPYRGYVYFEGETVRAIQSRR